MRVLLDTHAFIWWDDDFSRLSPAALAYCYDTANTLVVSTASIWEMQIKVQLGKMSFRMPLVEVVQQQQASNRIEILPVQLHHVFALDKLSDLHRDPFDRLLVAQAIAEGMPIISNDSLVSKYPVSVIW